MLKKLIAITLCLVLVLSLTACGAGSSAPKTASPDYNTGSSAGSYDMIFEEEAGYDYYSESSPGMDASAKMAPTAAPNASDSQRKIIRNVYIRGESENFDTATATVTQMITTLGGYMESSSISGTSLSDRYTSGREARYVLRIPADKQDAARTQLRELLNITNESEEAQDITQSYMDIEARLKTLRIQEERLLEILKTATDLENIIVLERSLGEIRYEIESYTTGLQRYDNLVDYTTLELSIYEVTKYSDTPMPTATFGDEVQRAFRDSINLVGGFLRWTTLTVITLAPMLVLLAIVILLIIFIVKKATKNRKITPRVHPAFTPPQGIQAPSNPTPPNKDQE